MAGPVSGGVSVIATCILRWVYEQASALLAIIKGILIAILSLINALIAQIRAFLAMLDPISLIDQFMDIIDALIQAMIDQFLAMFKQYGPGLDLCPEFYHYIVDPIKGYMSSFTAAFDPIREEFMASYSIVSLFDSYLTYWTDTQTFLTNLLAVVEDALYQALINEGVNAVVP